MPLKRLVVIVDVYSEFALTIFFFNLNIYYENKIQAIGIILLFEVFLKEWIYDTGEWSQPPNMLRNIRHSKILDRVKQKVIKVGRKSISWSLLHYWKDNYISTGPLVDEYLDILFTSCVFLRRLIWQYPSLIFKGILLVIPSMSYTKLVMIIYFILLGNTIDS